MWQEKLTRMRNVEKKKEREKQREKEAASGRGEKARVKTAGAGEMCRRNKETRARKSNVDLRATR